MDLLNVLIVLLVCCIIFFVFVIRYFRSTLLSGLSFLMMLVSIVMMAIGIIFRYSGFIHVHPLIFEMILFFAAIAMLILLFLPLVLLAVYFVAGLSILIHEGLKIKNCLSLGFTLIYLLLLIVFPFTGLLNNHHYLTMIYLIFDFIFMYVLFFMVLYVVSGLLNLTHLRKNHHFDAVIVLGAAVLGKRVTPLLASRINKGMEVALANEQAVLIFSGGQGEGEDISEGQAMADYAVSHGFDAKRIRIEDQSTDTAENLRNSMKLLNLPHPYVAIVTTSYHVFRSLLIARKQKIHCLGYGAKTKWYYTLNALIREFIAYLYLNYKIHAVLLLIGITFIIVTGLRH